MHMTDRALQLVRTQRHFVLYCVIGASGATLDYLIFLGLSAWTPISPVLASGISVSAGIVNNFILNVWFNFRDRTHLFKRFVAFYAVGFAGVLLSMLIIYVAHDRMGVAPWLAKLISIPIVVIAQFWLNKSVAFGDIEGHIDRIHWRETAILAGCGALTVANSLIFLDFGDEHDNFMGGVLLNRGELPYADFFSHHMPLAYYLAGVVTFFTGPRFVVFRITVALLYFTWMLLAYRNLRAALGARWALMGVAALTLLSPVMWTQQFTADALCAYAAFYFASWVLKRTWPPRGVTAPDAAPDHRRMTWWQTIGLATVAWIPVLSTAPMVLLSLAMGVVLVVEVSRSATVPAGWHRAWRGVYQTAVSSLPVLAFVAIPVLMTGDLHQVRWSITTFNTDYYAPFDPGVQPTISATFVAALIRPLSAIYQLTYGAGQENLIGSVLNMVAMLVTGVFALVAFRIRRREQRIGALLLVLLAYAAASRGGAKPFTYYHEAVFGTVFVVILLATMALVREERNVDVRPGLLQFSGALAALTLTASVAFGCLAAFPSWTGIAAGPRKFAQEQLAGENAKVAVLRSVSEATGGTYWDGPVGFYSASQIPERRASYFTFFFPWQARCPECNTRIEQDFAVNRPSVVHWTNEFLGSTGFAPAVDRMLAADYYRVKDPRLSQFYFRTSERTVIDAYLAREGFRVR